MLLIFNQYLLVPYTLLKDRETNSIAYKSPFVEIVIDLTGLNYFHYIFQLCNYSE